MRNEPPDGNKVYSLRLSLELYDLIAQAAEEDDRSVNSEIVALLKQALAARQRVAA